MTTDRRADVEPEFLELLEAHSRAIRRLCGAYTRDAADRQDLFQEIAIALWTALPGFRAAASKRTWLYRVAHNVALTYTAKRRRQHRTEQPLDGLAGEPASRDDGRRQALLDAVRQLEPVDRQLALLYLEGLSARETEEITGLTANNVAVRLSRLRRKLAATLRGEEEPR